MHLEEHRSELFYLRKVFQSEFLTVRKPQYRNYFTNFAVSRNPKIRTLFACAK